MLAAFDTELLQGDSVPENQRDRADDITERQRCAKVVAGARMHVWAVQSIPAWGGLVILLPGQPDQGRPCMHIQHCRHNVVAWWHCTSPLSYVFLMLPLTISRVHCTVLAMFESIFICETAIYYTSMRTRNSLQGKANLFPLWSAVWVSKQATWSSHSFLPQMQNAEVKYYIQNVFQGF